MKIGTVSDLGVKSEAVQQFYLERWPRPVSLSDGKFYKWQFVNTPVSNGIDTCVIAYDDKLDRIAGVMGLTPRVFSLSGKFLNGAELTTWIVGEEYRNTGAGAKILKRIIASYDILIGMGISESALPIYMRSGFRLLRQIPRFVKVLNFQNIAPFCEVNELGMRLVSKWSKPCIGGFHLKEMCDADIDLAFAAARQDMNLFARDADNMRWRYCSHPVFKYEMRHVSAGPNRDGVIVAFRIQETAAGFRMLHVMDIFGANQSVDAARSFIENFAVESGIDVIDFYCTSSQVSRHFIANNWFSVSDDTSFKFPHLFSPIEMRDPPTTSLIYWAQNELADLADLSRLYISKQDADLDRPMLKPSC